jgi:hypothetical protein
MGGTTWTQILAVGPDSQVDEKLSHLGKPRNPQCPLQSSLESSGYTILPGIAYIDVIDA